MTEIVLDGRTLTPASVVAIARRRAEATIDPAARERNAAAERLVRRLLERGDLLYGVTTGVGSLRSSPSADEGEGEHQWRLLRSHAGGGGAPLTVEVVRAAMAVRANQLGAGGAGVGEPLLDALLGAAAPARRCGAAERELPRRGPHARPRLVAWRDGAVGLARRRPRQRAARPRGDRPDAAARARAGARLRRDDPRVHGPRRRRGGPLAGGDGGVADDVGAVGDRIARELRRPLSRDLEAARQLLFEDALWMESEA